MPTELSWTEVRRATADVGALVRFRVAGRSSRLLPVSLGVLSLVTAAAVLVPASLPQQQVTRGDVRLLLPALLLGVLLLATAAAVSTGGGRELLPREHAVAYPVSPTTDHLGAVLLAPVSIAWLMQAWVLLGAVSYVVQLRPALLAALTATGLWLVCATALGQVVAWAVEWLRRGPRGQLVVRLSMAALGAVAALAAVGGVLAGVVLRGPTTVVAAGVLAPVRGDWATWVVVTGALAAASVVALVAGAWLACRVARRPSHDGVLTDSAPRRALPHPTSDLAALVRVDRAGAWRSPPIRRGLVVLALLPAVVALGGSFSWADFAILPGLVASGGALLFGVNAWSLDGRGARWRESLPVEPRLALASRGLVLAEILLVASAATVVAAAVPLGLPTTGQLSAVVCATVVVTVQTTATALRWSVRTPYAVNLRSTRATPAPPLVMVGYSARLALAVSVTGLVFNTAGGVGWQWPPVCAVPLLAWSLVKLARTTTAWSDPEVRSRVVATVAG